MYTMNGFVWNIVTVSPYSNMLQRSDGSYTCGMCDRNNQTIYISNILRHEICHSAMFSYGIDMTLEQEEMFCDFLATYADEIISITNNVFQTLRTAL